MNIEHQKSYILPYLPGEENMYKTIELVARVSHKSEDKIGKKDSKAFVQGLVDAGHTSVLEFGTLYLQSLNAYGMFFFDNNPYSASVEQKYVFNEEYNITANRRLITTNLRVLHDNGIRISDDFTMIFAKDGQELCEIVEPKEEHDKRIIVNIITSIGIARELERHRAFSFCEQSTRYCDYSNGKFDGVTFIGWQEDMSKELQQIEEYYYALRQDTRPEIARDILPLCTKTDLYMAGTESQWREFFKLRCSKQAHPMMRELAENLQRQMIKAGYKVEI